MTRLGSEPRQTTAKGAVLVTFLGVPRLLRYPLAQMSVYGYNGGEEIVWKLLKPTTHRYRVDQSICSIAAYTKSMKSVGFTRQQAEKMAEEQAKLIDERLATKEDMERVNANIEALRLSTKGDTGVLRLSTKADIEALRLATKADMELIRADVEKTAERTKAEILKWMFGQTIVILAAMIGILRAGVH